MEIIQGIYKITNIVNNKIYIGMSKNILKRFSAHKSVMKSYIETGVNRTRISEHLLKSVLKHGIDSFKFEVLEIVDNYTQILNREVYWIDKFNTLDRKFGYNLQRVDCQNSTVSESTSAKISERLRKEWSSGVRADHSKKLSEWFEKNPEQKIVKSKLLTKTLTKYEYHLYKSDIFVESCTYKDLVERGLKNALSNFHKSGKDFCKCKGFKVVRVKI